MRYGNSAPLNGLSEWEDRRRKWPGFDVGIRDGHLIDGCRSSRLALCAEQAHPFSRLLPGRLCCSSSTRRHHDARRSGVFNLSSNEPFATEKSNAAARY
jgi:hypothetical protein